MTEAEKRHAAAQKAAATYREHRAKQRERERERQEERDAQIAALKKVRDDPDSPSGDVLRAVELLMQLDK